MGKDQLLEEARVEAYASTRVAERMHESNATAKREERQRQRLTVESKAASAREERAKCISRLCSVLTDQVTSDRITAHVAWRILCDMTASEVYIYIT